MHNSKCSLPVGLNPFPHLSIQFAIFAGIITAIYGFQTHYFK